MQPVPTLSVAFGCFKLADKKKPDYLSRSSEVIANALNSGYTIFDFASAYGTHKALPSALKTSARAIEIHSKITLQDIQKRGLTEAAQTVLDELKIKTLDVLYLHAPDAISEESIKQLQLLKAAQKIKNIGLSNINVSQLRALYKKGFLPDYVQVEISPLCYDKNLIEFCRDNGIALVGYRPLGEGKLLDKPLLKEIAKSHFATVAQVIHRWCAQKGIIPLTKSTNPKHQKENLDINHFSLSEKQMKLIDNLQEKEGRLKTCNWEKFINSEDLMKANQWMGCL